MIAIFLFNVLTALLAPTLEKDRGEGITAYGGSPTPDPTAGYLQNNILATVVNPALGNTPGGIPASPAIAANLAVFANTNAQDLKCVAYTDNLGPIATTIDYTNSDNGNGIVRQTQIVPNYYGQPGIMGNPLSGIWAAPIPPAFTAAQVLNPVMEFLNISAFPLVLHPAVGSPTIGVAPGTWAVDAMTAPTITLAPFAPFAPPAAPMWVDYYGNGGIINALTVTAHAEANGPAPGPLACRITGGILAIPRREMDAGISDPWKELPARSANWPYRS